MIIFADEMTGAERYMIRDAVTGGVRFATDKAGMFASVFYFVRVLGHPCQVTDRDRGTAAEYVFRSGAIVAEIK